MCEARKPIPGFDGYTVSDRGVVRSGEAPLKPFVKSNGYLTVGLWRGRRSKTCYVHHLVAEGFLPQRPVNKELNHKDGIKANCAANNLEWVTRAENVQHSYDVVGRKRHSLAKPIVLGGVEYASLLAASETLNVGRSTLRRALLSNTKVRGMEIRYA